MRLALPSAAARLPARALSLASGWPWYGWAAAAAAGLATLLFGAFALGATGGESEGEGGSDRPPGPPPLLKLGSSGPWVSYLQARLGIERTGTFDAATDAAVKAFQSANALTVDGIVGPASWKALGVEGAAPAPPAGGGGGAAPPAPPGPPATAPTPTTGNPFGLSDTIATREGQILSLIGQGSYEHQWVPLTWTVDGHTVSVKVSRRALALSDGTHRLIVNGTARSAQKAADMIGGALLTTRMIDEIAKQAPVKVLASGAPVPPSKPWQGQGTDESGSKTFRMYDQSNYLDKRVAELGDDGTSLVSNEGKDWPLSRRHWTIAQGGLNGSWPKDAPNSPAGVSGSPHNRANFGWYPGSSKSPGGASVIQQVGLAHGPEFTDYSQLWRFMQLGSLTIDGQPWDYEQALKDPTVSKYIQDEGGTLPGARHPDDY